MQTSIFNYEHNPPRIVVPEETGNDKDAVPRTIVLDARTIAGHCALLCGSLNKLSYKFVDDDDNDSAEESGAASVDSLSPSEGSDDAETETKD